MHTSIYRGTARARSKLPTARERLSEADEEVWTPRAFGHQVRRAAEEVRRSNDVSPGARGVSGCPQTLGGPGTEHGICRAEFRTVAVGLLEVVADDLVRCCVAKPGDEPIGIRLVQRGPLSLGDLVVRGVPDQGVSEAEPVITRHDRSIGPDQLLAHERQQVGTDIDPLPLGQQRRDGPPMEEAALDRATLDHSSLRLGQAIDARSE